MLSRRKRLLLNLALAALTVVLCLTAFEVVLRLAGYGNLEVYEPDPKVYWRLKPNQDCFTKVDHRPVHINAQGTRGPEFSATKPPGTLRILSLGDSRTFGWGLRDEETYSRQLERLWQEHVEKCSASTLALSPGGGSQQQRDLAEPGVAGGALKRVEVINAGVNGWSYPQMLVFYREFAVRWEPDMVVLGDANLWTQFTEKNDLEFVRKFMSRVRLKNVLRRIAIYHYVLEIRLRRFYERYRTKFIPIDPKKDTLFKEQQQADSDTLFRDAIMGICALAKTNGAQPVLLFLPTLDDLAATNELPVLRWKKETAQRFDAPLADLTPDLSAQGKALYLEGDPVHLNAAGNTIVARRLFESMTNHFAR